MFVRYLSSVKTSINLLLACNIIINLKLLYSFCSFFYGCELWDFNKFSNSDLASKYSMGISTIYTIYATIATQ